MYEVGYAHGRGLTPLIYTQDETRLKKLPVYFKALNVRLVSEATPLITLIDRARGADPEGAGAVIFQGFSVSSGK